MSARPGPASPGRSTSGAQTCGPGPQTCHLGRRHFSPYHWLQVHALDQPPLKCSMRPIHSHLNQAIDSSGSRMGAYGKGTGCGAERVTAAREGARREGRHIREAAGIVPDDQASDHVVHCVLPHGAVHLILRPPALHEPRLRQAQQHCACVLRCALGACVMAALVWTHTRCLPACPREYLCASSAATKSWSG